MTTIEIKTAIYGLIAAVVTRTYELGHVKKGATFPYAVYALTDSLEGEVDYKESIRYPLEIDIYDHDKDMNTTEVENLADAVNEVLDRVHYLGNGFYIYFILRGRHPNFPTEDEFTFRRNLRYEAKIYKESD